MTADVAPGGGSEHNGTEGEIPAPDGTAPDVTLSEPGVAESEETKPAFGFWSRIPLRIKLIAAMLALLALAIAVIGVASTVALRRYLLDRIDEQLASTTQHLIEHPEQRPAPGYNGLPSDYLLALLPPERKVVIAVYDRNTYSADDLPALADNADELFARVGEPFTVGSADRDHRWRLLVTALPEGNTLTVGEDLAAVENALDRLAAIEVLVGVAVLLALALVGVWVVRRSLRPLGQIEATAAAIAGGDLARRVPDFGPATEVGRLGGALNAMLAQIEAAFTARAESEQRAVRSEERMRQFVADASHELRTPLTTIRGFAELYRQGAAGDPSAVMRRIEDEAARMGLLVEDLLLLARLDEERPLQETSVRLARLIQDAAAGAHAVSPDRTIQVDLPPSEEGLTVLGDETRLRQVIGNLVTNALMHTPAGTSVRLALRSERTPEQGYAVVEVSDAGPGLTDEQAERVFERFYRVDKARTRQAAGKPGRAVGNGATAAPHSGTGLGLAIVAALVAAHEGSVEVETAPGEGATFRVRLPLPAPVVPVADDATESPGTTGVTDPAEPLIGSFNSQETSSQDPGEPQRSRASSDT